MTTQDTELQDTHAKIAAALDKPVEEIAAMTKEQMIDATARISFNGFGLEVAYHHNQADGVQLMEDGPTEQAARVTAALTKFHAHTPLYPVRSQDISVNLFGFGRAPVHFVTFDDDGQADERYLLLSEVAEQLGVPLHKAHEWARDDWADALSSQRERDEERGELGWECLQDLADLGLWMTVDDDQANPDAGGKRWSTAGDWLISAGRLLAFMTVSPWCTEFLDNAGPLFSHAFLHSGLADTLGEVATYRQPPWDGPMEPTGSTLGDHFRREAEEIPEDEAARRAMRGPSGPLTE